MKRLAEALTKLPPDLCPINQTLKDTTMIIDLLGVEIKNDEWTEWRATQTLTLEFTRRELEVVLNWIVGADIIVHTLPATTKVANVRIQKCESCQILGRRRPQWNPIDATCRNARRRMRHIVIMTIEDSDYARSLRSPEAVALRRGMPFCPVVTCCRILGDRV